MDSQRSADLERFRRDSWSHQTRSAAPRGHQSALPQQFANFSLQRKTLFVTQVGEAKRLQVTQRNRHRKQHRRLATHRVRTQVKRQVDRDSFIQAVGQFEQASGGRNPQRLGPELPAILELNRGRNRLPKADARGAEFSSGVGEVGH
jgi:hypothetical protein